MTPEYLIWAVLNKEVLAFYERQQIAELLKQLIKDTNERQ